MKNTKSSTILPYASLFIFLFSMYLVYNVTMDLNPNLIPYIIGKLLKLIFWPAAIVVELSGLRDRAWNIWKKIPVVTHLLVSFFFSLIILKLVPIAVQKVWKEDNESFSKKTDN